MKNWQIVVFLFCDMILLQIDLNFSIFADQLGCIRLVLELLDAEKEQRRLPARQRGNLGSDLLRLCRPCLLLLWFKVFFVRVPHSTPVCLDGLG